MEGTAKISLSRLKYLERIEEQSQRVNNLKTVKICNHYRFPNLRLEYRRINAEIIEVEETQATIELAKINDSINEENKKLILEIEKLIEANKNLNEFRVNMISKNLCQLIKWYFKPIENK